MNKAIKVVEGMISEDIPDTDFAEVVVPRNIDSNFRNRVLREVISKLKLEKAATIKKLKNGDN